MSKKPATLMPSLTLNLSEDTSLNLYAYLQHDPNGGYHGSLPASGTLEKRNGRRLSGSFFEGDPDIEEFKRTQNMLGYEFQHRFNDVWSARQNFRYLDAEVENSQVWQSGYYWTPADSNELYRGFSGEKRACMPGSSTTCCRLNSLPVRPFIPLL